MRNILFKAKGLYSKCWVHGSLVITRNEKEHYIVSTNAENCGGVEFDLGCIVDPKSVGQYTMLNDKKGKFIYEGDIVQITIGNIIKGKMHPERTEIGVIERCKDRFLMKINNEYKDISPLKYIEVIGNIHDNPELSFRLNNGGLL